MTQICTKLTAKCRQILNQVERLLKVNGRVSMQDIAHAMNHDLAARVHAEVSYLVAEGYLVKHGRPGTREVHVTMGERKPFEFGKEK